MNKDIDLEANERNVDEKNSNKINPLKLAVFVKLGLDNFLDDVINKLNYEFEIRKIVVTGYEQIDDGMKWADVCFFEWCDELVQYGSNHNLSKQKKIICRLHSYEAFTDYPSKVKWENVDDLICVAEHIKNYIVSKFAIDSKIIKVIPNGIDLKKYTFGNRKHGFNLAYAGYINYKKGPMLLLHAFKAIFDKDQRYKLFIAGEFQDERDILYFNQMTKEFGIENNVIFNGWQEDLDKWLENKNYIICTSILESQNISVMQAMSKGIKPIIHNFVGAKYIYPEQFLWNTIGEAVKLISEPYNSKDYRNYIEDNYSIDKQILLFSKVIKFDREHLKYRVDTPVVTVGISSYNHLDYLELCLQSVLSQTYKKIEILVVDDNSSDGSVDIIKEYERKYENIRAVFYKQNHGAPFVAFNHIINEAKGKYFCLLGSDDMLAVEDTIEKFVDIFEKNKDLDYVYGNLQIVNKEGTPIDLWKYSQLSNSENIYRVFRGAGAAVIPMTGGIFKTDFYRKDNRSWFLDKEIGESDCINTLVNSLYGCKHKYEDINFIKYRRHDANITYNVKLRVNMIIQHLEYIVNNFSEQIYYPEIKWDSYNTKYREALKLYLIGQNYYRIYKMYFEEKWKPWEFEIGESRTAYLKDIEPIKDKIFEYFGKCVKLESSFLVEIDNIRAGINKVKTVENNMVLTKDYSSDIVDAGSKLRNNILEKHFEKYKSKNCNILILSPDNGVWKYTFTSWKSVMEYMGIKVDIVFEINKIKTEQYDIFISICNKNYLEVVRQNKNIEMITERVGILDKEEFRTSENTINDDFVLDNLISTKTFNILVSHYYENYISFIFKTWIEKGLKVFSIPFGFNPLIHYPEITEKEYDYFFVGTNSYRKVKETNEYLIPVINKFKGILRGNGWSSDIIDLSIDEVREYYNKAKINLNYHMDIQKQYENEINERTYIIAACGGFQLVDNPKLLRKLYSENEMAIANNGKEYLEKFSYFINKPKERQEIAYNSLIKTYSNNSSLFDRMDCLLNLCFLKLS